MLRVILRNVQAGLIFAATLLVILAFQRLSLYSVPVLVGNIVHPGATHPSGDSADGTAASRKELVGHGHAHGQHRIFSTNVIEVGLFKFVVPFRWSSANQPDDVDLEAVKEVGGESEKEHNSGSIRRRSRGGRAGRNKPRHTHPANIDAEKSHLLGSAPPMISSKDSYRKGAGEEETALSANQTNASDVHIDPLLLLPINETLIETESNVTALPARRLSESDKRLTWLRWRDKARREKF
mmetsp:Transcript_20084/g.47452  ORF Transcript_20084/g.47452 Transcript_20084/m.47452 type:complete len:239 (+) Transcript_20084:207-923(+)|eukprot:CAMPEP_0185803262 /NCGR_PEP_ID=MMETSP1322-20130828/2523_1 /TAXON_ID=265543 /ORGANISM="Minutocellus polymorphus, Strain RCC2270" /LENGTH=238 /DNA_ID=CAMNT_0028499125 /DNA_START=179 /DNA_END=895 /DNA_ORIENTATION=+